MGALTLHKINIDSKLTQNEKDSTYNTSFNICESDICSKIKDQGK